MLGLGITTAQAIYAIIPGIIPVIIVAAITITLISTGSTLRYSPIPPHTPKILIFVADVVRRLDMTSPPKFDIFTL